MNARDMVMQVMDALERLACDDVGGLTPRFDEQRMDRYGALVPYNLL